VADKEAGGRRKDCWCCRRKTDAPSLTEFLIPASGRRTVDNQRGSLDGLTPQLERPTTPAARAVTGMPRLPSSRLRLSAGTPVCLATSAQIGRQSTADRSGSAGGFGSAGGGSGSSAGGRFRREFLIGSDAPTMHGESCCPGVRSGADMVNGEIEVRHHSPPLKWLAWLASGRSTGGKPRAGHNFDLPMHLQHNEGDWRLPPGDGIRFIMEIHRIILSRAQLAAMPEAERVVLLLLAHASNEINVLSKLIMMMRKDDLPSPIHDAVEEGRPLF
jgi:hypothetical protein